MYLNDYYPPRSYRHPSGILVPPVTDFTNEMAFALYQHPLAREIFDFLVPFLMPTGLSNPLDALSVNDDDGEFWALNKKIFTWDPSKYIMYWTPTMSNITVWTVGQPFTYYIGAFADPITITATQIQGGVMVTGNVNKSRSAIPANSATTYPIGVALVSKTLRS